MDQLLEKIASDGQRAFVPVHLQAASMLRERPALMTVETTDRCNLRCKFCYVPRGRSAPPAQLDLHRLMPEAAGLGVLTVIFTGGECMTVPGFLDIHELTRQRCGMLTVLFTNGTLLTRHAVERLARCPPLRIEITVYGASAATYERVTGSREAYEQCRAAVAYIMEARIPLRLKTTVCFDNVRDVDAIREMAHGLGVPYRCDALLLPRTDRDSTPTGYRLPVDQIADLDSRFPERERAWRDLGTARDREPEGRFRCQAGSISFGISASGRVALCIPDQQGVGRWPEMSLAELWAKVREARREPPGPHNRCLPCTLSRYCPACPARNYLETGDPDGVVDEYCALARRRAALFAGPDIRDPVA